MKERLKQLRKTLGLIIGKPFTSQEAWFPTGQGEMIDEEATLSKDEAYLLDIFRKIAPGSQKIVLNHAENLFSYEQTSRGTVPKTTEKKEAIR